jgi:hypothetical protein
MCNTRRPVVTYVGFEVLTAVSVRSVSWNMTQCRLLAVYWCGHLHKTYRMFQKELTNFESLYKFIQRAFTVIWTAIVNKNAQSFTWDSYGSMWLSLVRHGVSKRFLQLYSNCNFVTGVTKTFTLKGVQTINRSRCSVQGPPQITLKNEHTYVLIYTRTTLIHLDSWCGQQNKNSIQNAEHSINIVKQHVPTNTAKAASIGCPIGYIGKPWREFRTRYKQSKTITAAEDTQPTN